MRTVHKPLTVLLRKYAEATALIEVALDHLIECDYDEVEIIIDQLYKLGVLTEYDMSSINNDLDRLKVSCEK